MLNSHKNCPTWVSTHEWLSDYPVPGGPGRMTDLMCDEEELTNSGNWWNENAPDSPETIWNAF